MKFRHVAKISFSDGIDPIYFIDGDKREDIYSDNQLLRLLLGKSFEECWIRPSDDMTEDEQSAVWNLSFFDTLDDMEQYLKDNRSLLEEA